MTDVKPRFDPRYDERFQRGYVSPEGGGAARSEPRVPDASSAPVPQSPPVPPSAPVAAVDDLLAALAEPRTDAPRAAAHAEPAGSGAAPPAPSRDPLGRRPDGPRALAGVLGAGTSGHAAPDDAAPATVAPTSVAPVAPVAPDAPVTTVASDVPVAADEPTPRPVATRWLWLVLAASVACLVVSGILTWQSSMGFWGSVSLEEQRSLVLMSSLAGPLAQVGVLGGIAALLAWALFAPVAWGRRR
ncbi:hypothetical protein ACDF64_06200 [Agromyces sp. MMS24-JH15]|uniref:hypothetical protein n=1 Tax=Agromyces sp. MMS24-JH15 TaxID=3243765 RepID=UPI003748D3D2